MHIAKRTPDLLVLTDSGSTPRTIGAVLLTVGGFFIYSGNQASSLQLLPVVIGVLAMLGGIAFVILPGRVIAAFDKPSHTLVLTRRTIHGSTRDEVDFSKITDVTAESSTMSSDSATTFRVAIVLKDGTRIPLTTWYTSSPLHAVAAAATEEFLGLTPAAAAAPAATAPATGPVTGLFVVRRQHAQSRGSIGCMMVFASIFLAISAGMIFTMWSRLTNWRPVNAVVLSTDVTAVRGSKSTSYRPDVTYRYEVDGRSYVNRHATILNESRGTRWAYDVIRRYPQGTEVIAYVDPANPARAYLVHEWSFFPFLFAGIPVLMMLSGLWTLRQMPAKRRDGAPPATVAPGSGTA